MAKLLVNMTTVLTRLLKGLVVVVLIPFTIGLLGGLLDQLDFSTRSGSTFRQWIEWGVATYIGVHLLLYRPVALFRASHRLFATLAVWLFGGQVTSVGETARGGGGKGPKGSKEGSAASGSPLVAFSPYVIPLYTILVAALGWLAVRWVDRACVDGPASFLIGVTIALHWFMTADDLQQQRAKWHLETYLLAINLVFIMTLLLGGASLAWVVPEFSFLRALADGLSRTQAIYTTLIQRLFF